jgi:hypothetical protein
MKPVEGRVDGRGLGLLGALAGLHEQADGHHEGGDQPAGEGGAESDQECVEDVLPVHGLLLGLGS